MWGGFARHSCSPKVGDIALGSEFYAHLLFIVVICERNERLILILRVLIWLEIGGDGHTFPIGIQGIHLQLFSATKFHRKAIVAIAAVLEAGNHFPLIFQRIQFALTAFHKLLVEIVGLEDVEFEEGEEVIRKAAPTRQAEIFFALGAYCRGGALCAVQRAFNRGRASRLLTQTFRGFRISRVQ